MQSSLADDNKGSQERYDSKKHHKSRRSNKKSTALNFPLIMEDAGQGMHLNSKAPEKHKPKLESSLITNPEAKSRFKGTVRTSQQLPNKTKTEPLTSKPVAVKLKSTDLDEVNSRNQVRAKSTMATPRNNEVD